MLKYLLVFLSVCGLQAQFLSNGRGGGGAPLAASIYYVSINGNDSTAVAGDATKAFAKISAAVSNAVNNSVIYIMPDTHTITPYLVQEPDIDTLATAGTINFINKTNITIRGPGSIIYGAGQGNLMIIKDSDNITLDGLTFWGNRPTTNAVCIATNYGHVFMCGGGDNINFKNCTFKEFGQFGICHTDNIDESANDNPNRISIDSCSFVNGGATNVVGLSSRGGALGVRARVISMVNSSCDNLLTGIVAYNQDSSSRVTATNTTVRIMGNTFNNILEGVLIAKHLNSSILYTNDQTVVFIGNTLTDIGTLFPSQVPIGTSYCLTLFTAKKAIITGNYMAGNFSCVGVTLSSQVRRSSVTFTGNTLKNMHLGFVSTRGLASMEIDGCNISDNTFDNHNLSAITFGGKNSIIANNTLLSICTNSTTSAQISVDGVVGLETTNVVVIGNSFGDNVVGVNGNSILFQADTNCFAIRFEDNMTLGRISSLTNNYIRHFGTGLVKHRYKFTSANSTLTTCFAHYFPFTNGQSGVFSVNAIGSTVVTGTNWVASQIKLCSFKNYLGNVVHYTTGTGLNAAMSVIDPPLAGFSADMIGTNGYIYTRHAVPSGMTIPNNVEVIISLTK